MTYMTSTNNQIGKRIGHRGRPSKLKKLIDEHPADYERMLALIRAGAFARGAAQAMGIAPETFSRWLTRGLQQRRGIYRQFRQDVEQAQAQSRCVAEMRVYRENPLAWLRLGPGRSRPGVPGWTNLREANREPSPPPRPIAKKPPMLLPIQNPLAGLAVMEELGYVTILPAGRAMMSIGMKDEGRKAIDDRQSRNATLS
jgi:hypothetical protein